jgi:D-glycero-D-manno-heptose 1,7-bisphosphate phosphatase
MKKIILLDRDGIINQDSMDYIKSTDEFIPLPGSIHAIARLTKAHYQIGIATNQSGIARGYYSERQLRAIHDKLVTLVESFGGNITAIEYCPHMPEASCYCRKPQPGMLLKLGKRLGYSDLTGVSFVGDRVSDIQAALAAGANPIIVLSPMTNRFGLLPYSVPIFHSLAAYVDWLLPVC